MEKLMKKKGEALLLGAEIIQWLLPYRRPFLMIDKTEWYTPGKQPMLQAVRCLTINEAVFAGHFPGLAIFPASLILEGCCQAAHMLVVLSGLQQAYEAQGKAPAQVLEDLRNVERGFRLDPGFDPAASAYFVEELEAADWERIGMTASSNVKFLKPVFAGDRITYRVRVTRTFGTLLHHEIEAEVEGQLVAKGTYVSSRIDNQQRPRLTTAQ